MLTKTEAIQKLTKSDEAGITKLEEKIDAVLCNYAGSPISVDVTGVSLRVVSRIESMYEQAGWEVKRKHENADQSDPRERDSDWLVFG